MRIREKRKLQREEKRGEREREKKEHKESSKTQDNNNKEKVSGHSEAPLRFSQQRYFVLTKTYDCKSHDLVLSGSY